MNVNDYKIGVEVQKRMDALPEHAGDRRVLLTFPGDFLTALESLCIESGSFTQAESVFGKMCAALLFAGHPNYVPEAPANKEADT